MILHSDITSNLSIYIHWPFCQSKCPYCDFNSHVSSNIAYSRWQAAYSKELKYFQSLINGRYIKSIFFGGGTPSLMPPHLVKDIVTTIKSLGKVDQNTEITLEANPTSFEVEKFYAFREAGVNRLSIGVQSLRQDGLKFLGRQHDNLQAIAAIKEAAKIFDNFSFDLMYARAEQELSMWQDELIEAIELAEQRCTHLSLYQLTIEKGTPFYRLFQDKHFILPENEVSAKMYEWTNRYLSKKGYEQYEISNYAKANHLQCRHNLTYWRYEDYLGIGPGAHSRLIYSPEARESLKEFKVSAMMMIHKPSRWLESVEIKGYGIQSQEDLTPDIIAAEYIMMGLRIKEGLNLKRLKDLTNYDLESIINFNVVKEYQHLKLLEYDDNTLRLSKKGLSLHNYITTNLLKL